MLKLASTLLLSGTLALHAATIDVDSADSFRAALTAAKPGTHIRVAPGKYKGEFTATALSGTLEEPIIVEGADGDTPTEIFGGRFGFQLNGCSFWKISNLSVKQAEVGFDINDNERQTPTKGILLTSIATHSTRLQGIKLSGVDAFRIEKSEFNGGAVEAPVIDMLGCHHGVITQTSVSGRGYGAQARGGSSDIVIEKSEFKGTLACGVKIGGYTRTVPRNQQSTRPPEMGLAGRMIELFRPEDANYEARNITVEDCMMIECRLPFVISGAEDTIVRYNTLIHPAPNAVMIMQENPSREMIPCRNGTFSNNRIVFNQRLSPAILVYPNVDRSSFRFEKNAWYCDVAPAASSSLLNVGVKERYSTVGVKNPVNAGVRK